MPGTQADLKRFFASCTSNVSDNGLCYSISSAVHSQLNFFLKTEFPAGRYDPQKPLATDCITHDVAHYIAGAAVLCRPMMDFALNHIEQATAEIVKKLPVLQNAQLEAFEHGLRMALLNMYEEPDQWIIRALRIVMGKLMAVCFHIILQSPAWSTKFEKLWGVLRVRVVADHKWLYQAGLCERNAVIMYGFEHMSILWTKYRGEEWQPADDLMFPEDAVDTLPKPPQRDPPSTPHGNKKKSKAIPIISPGGTIAPRPNTLPRGKGRGRGAPTGLVEPAPQPARGKGKQKMKAQVTQKAAIGTIEEGESSKSVKATPTPASGATTEAAPSSAGARNDPFASDETNISYWADIASKSSFPPLSGPEARRASSPSRPGSSSSALSATAQPFLPSGSQPSAGSSTTGVLSYSVHRDPRVSDAYLEDPARLAELYGTDDDEPVQKQDKGKGKEVAGPATSGSSSSSHGASVETTDEEASLQETTGQMTLELSSLDISKDDDEARTSTSPHRGQSEHDI